MTDNESATNDTIATSTNLHEHRYRLADTLRMMLSKGTIRLKLDGRDVLTPAARALAMKTIRH